MPAIFISYRRDDSQSATGRLADHLAARFGAEEVFRDLEDMQPGNDFRVSLVDALQTARAVVVVVGRSWLGVKSDGTRRIDDARDYVRREVEMALTQEVPIVPVLVEGARMPNVEELPASIGAFAYKQAHELSESRWAYDTERLVEALAQTADLEQLPADDALAPVRTSPMATIPHTLAQLPADFLHLLFEPNRFLIERGLAAHHDLLRAFAFLLVSQLIAAGLVLQEWPTRSPTLQFLLTPAMLALIVAVALSLPLYCAWRLVGAPREYWRLLVIVLYQCSFVGVGFSLATLITLIALNIAVPGTTEALARNLTLEGLVTLLRAMEAAPAKAPLAVSSMIIAFLLVVLLVWLLATWRAYQTALHQTRRRSWAALGLFTLFCLVPLGFLAWVAMIVENR